MSGRIQRWLALFFVLRAVGAAGFEEAVRKEEVDAGVHVPTLTKAPALLQFVPATYPEEAEQAGLSGSVTLQITLGADGSVTDAVVTKPAGHGFDEAAVAAVKQFRFSPAEVDGVPAPIQLEYVYHFELAPKPPPKTPAPPAAKRATLTGQVIARGSRKRVAGALVRCGDQAGAPETYTDDDGRFRLSTPPGLCSVRVVASGYETFRTDETLAEDETVEVTFHVSQEAGRYETVVRGEREKKEVVRRTLQREEVEKVPGTFGDPIRVLQNLPGVARAPFLSGALVVRGASPDETATFLDGVEIPLLFHLGGGPSVVNPEFLDRIDFYPGGFGARYGRAIGGVVDVGTRRGASDTWHGSAKVDLLDTSVFVEAPVGTSTSVAAAARRSYIDGLLPLVLPKDPEGGSLLIVPRYEDYQLRIDHGATRGQAASGPNTFDLMAFGSDDVLKIVATGGGRNQDIHLDVHTLFHRIKGGWVWKKGDLSSTFAPYTGYDLAKFGFGVTTISADIYTAGAREDLSATLSKHVVLRGGFDLLYEHLVGKADLPVIGGTQYVDFPGADPQTEKQHIQRIINGFDGALYTEADLKAGPVTVTPGLRATHSQLHARLRNTLEPRLWVRYQLTEPLALKGSVGLYTQPPDLTDLEQAPFGSPFLVHEKAFQTSLGVEDKLTDVLNVDLTGFYNRRYDLVVSPGPTDVLPSGEVIAYRYSNEGLGRAYGLELLVRHEITKHFFGWIAYTLSRSVQRRTDSQGHEQTNYRLTSFDETHILTAVGSYAFGKGWEIGGRFRYVTGRPKTPLLHPYDLYQADEDSYSATRGAFRSDRQPAFNQLDLRVDKNFVFTSWTLDLYLDIQNVYNAQNVETTFTDYRFREEIPVPGIPFLPVLGVKGTF